MDIPREISAKIASYIRRPTKDEDIFITIGFSRSIWTYPGGSEFQKMPLYELMVRMRRIGKKESVIQRHAQWARRKWASGEREIFIY